MIFRLLVLGFFLIPCAANCDWLRQAAGLTAELQRRYPDSRIEIDDAREDGGRRIEVRIVASSFEEDRNLAEEARMIAQEVRRRYELHGPRDRVKVDFRSERRNGPFASTREASFTYPASATER